MKWINSKHACEMLGISMSTLNRLCKSKKIEVYKLGTQRRFSEENLIEFMKGVRQ